jgi:NAD(P)-dependent dehydrogenase (short-subunit alcohol dehydrogenase family)
VRSFLRKGVRKVVIGDIVPLEEVVAALNKDYADAEILAVKCNVAEEADVVALHKAAVDKFGRLDYAVNCAGVPGGAPWAEFETEIWDKTIGVNERGVFMCMREQLKIMGAQDYTTWVQVCAALRTQLQGRASQAAGRYRLHRLDLQHACDSQLGRIHCIQARRGWSRQERDIRVWRQGRPSVSTDVQPV